VLFTHDTIVLKTDKNYDDFKQKINLTFSSISQWFDASQLVLNIMTTNIVKFTPINSAHSRLVIEYKHTTIEEAAGTKLLGLYIDIHMNWK